MTPAVAGEIEDRRLRWQLYNATLESVRDIHEDLRVFRVRSDRPKPAITPGQYVVLGLGDWESRCDGIRPVAHGPDRRPAIIRRAYSVCCEMVERGGNLVRIADREWLEFYIVLVRTPRDTPPTLTPRLFALEPGRRLYLGPHVRGRYTLEPVASDDDVVFCATGTGEAPHVAMVAELLAAGHRGRIASIVCTRYRRDLGYANQNRQVEQRFDNYRYLPLTTREPENLDASRPDHVGKTYVQDVFADEERCREHLGFVPVPGKTHFYLCGNPAMIGLPKEGPDGRPVFPQPLAMTELLVRRGFRLDEGHARGDVHFEKYW